MTLDLANTIISQVEDKFAISKSLLSGEQKLVKIVEILKGIQSVATSGVKEVDLTAIVQFFYRVVKLVRKDKSATK